MNESKFSLLCNMNCVNILGILIFIHIQSSFYHKSLASSRNDSRVDCNETIISRVHRASLVFSGTVRNLNYNPQQLLEAAQVEIKRIFKGEDLLTNLKLQDVQGRFLPIKHQICTVTNFHHECSTRPKLFDTWFFFGRPLDGNFHLTSPLLKMSIHSIAHAEAASKGWLVMDACALEC